MINFFVIGNQTSKSLSPLIFNHWFKRYNIRAKYSFLEVTKKNFDNEIVKKISYKKTKGFNVTIPFKKDIIKHLDNKNILSSVGCYQVERLGPQIIKSIKGDFFNVLGFPLFPFLTFLSKR